MTDKKEELPVIKGYEIKKVIGKGGCGVVYMAIHSKTGETVAIKLHLTEGLKESKNQELLLKEVMIWNNLSHPNIVKFRACGFTKSGKLYVVSDLIEGQNLQQVIEKNQMALSQILKLSIEICDAIAHVHGKDVIHQDIKPSNILLDRAGIAFLSDFGFAVHSTEKSKTYGGTAGYMSPEQEKGDKKAITSKSDIYSLGVVIKELLKGKASPKPRRTIRSNLKISDASHQEATNELDRMTIQKLEEVCEIALQGEPDSRFASAVEMRERLVAIQSEYFASDLNVNLSQSVIPGLSGNCQAEPNDEIEKHGSKEANDWTSRIHDHVSVFESFSDMDYQNGLDRFSRLMGYLIEIPEELKNEIGGENVNVFERLVDSIIDPRKKDRSIIFQGAPGTGKSSVLGMLAIATRRNLSIRGDVAPNVDYVNIHDLDEICRGDYNSNKGCVDKRIAEIVKSIGEKFNGRDGFLFVDGLERHKRDRVPETQKLFIGQCKRIRSIKIVGVGEYDGIEHACDEKERNAEEIPFAGTLVRLRSVPKEEFSNFCKEFVDFHRFISSVKADWNHRVIDADTLYSRISNLKTNRIDLLRMDIMSVVDDARSLSFTSAVESYCERQFEVQLLKGSTPKEDTKKAIRDAAECVFQMFVSKNQETSKRYAIRCWGFVTGHPAIRNFLIAKHVIQVLCDIGEKIKRSSGQGKGRSGFDYVREFLDSGLDNKLYPSDINVHCKNIMNSEKLDNLMLALDSLLTSKSRELSHTSTIHLCYLVGRIQGRNREALRILRFFITNTSKRDTVRDNKSRDEMSLLECTYTISLICLDPERSHVHAEKFLDLLNDKDWASNAIAFHLMYYGDHDFDFSFPKSFRTVPGDTDYRRTLDTIGARILSICQTEDGWYPLFDIDVAIVCLLLLSRQSLDTKRNELSSQCKKRARFIIDKVRESTNSRISSRPVMPFVRFALSFSSRHEATDALDIVTKFYECKYDTQRAGWLNKIRIDGRIESVADHSWGAMLLAEIILPEKLPDAEYTGTYSKAEVIRSLLIHDLAEAYTGDRPADNPGQEYKGVQRREELDFIELISFLRVADSGQSTGLVFGFEKIIERWKSVENRSDINGKIANFFDKCDAFVQFVVYSKYFFEQSRHHDHSSTWRSFFEILKREFNSSFEGVDFLRNLSVRIIMWATRVFESDKPYLPHDEIFSGYGKYFPARNIPGVIEQINFDTHNSISRKRENTNRSTVEDNSAFNQTESIPGKQ